ncbi:uncharacterized protein ARMOST_06001 [Armillaria ostoyae]|uniref:Uncharacterized protein n=1 Tax=Armillaria ostoyae TaxID=47428 RepID=A0A284R1S7_ARMOS|nr:uncharacterized protein ARMOST_06001 [Armillaria ostoyae]
MENTHNYTYSASSNEDTVSEA